MSFFFNPTIWLAVVLAFISMLITSPTALAAITPQLMADLLLTVALLLIVLAVFQSGRLPLDPDVDDSDTTARQTVDPSERTVSNVIDVDFGSLHARTLTWPVVRTRLVATFAGLLALFSMVRRREELSPA